MTVILNDPLKDNLDKLKNALVQIDKLQNQIMELDGEKKALLEALVRFGFHMAGCPALLTSATCSCGFWKALGIEKG